MEFNRTKTEMTRRKKAYLTMVCFLIIGLFLFFKLLDLPMLPIAWIPFVIMFSLLGVVSFASLHKLERTRVIISDKEIRFVHGSEITRYLLIDVQSVRIKRRSTGSIREITLVLQGRERLSINGFEDGFEQLKDTLIHHLDKSISIREVIEPMDFDHPLFYPIFGTLMSLGFVLIIKIIIKMS